ncbi:MAG: thiamine-phosphate kinase [Candidatus Hodarchaeota archaeon]
MKVHDLGEKKLIARLREKLKIDENEHFARFDDAFYFESINRGNLVLNTDMLVGKTDIPKIMDYYQVGRKSVIMNVSDLIVKNIKPEGMVVSFGFPRNLEIENFDKLIGGILEISENYNIQYLGGDINESDDLIVNITIFGFQEGNIISRHGIQEEDIVAVTGEFGFTTAGLFLILNKLHSEMEPKYEAVVNAVLQPQLNYDSILGISNQEGISASIDSSDGLSASLLDLMDVNDFGFEIDNLPINPLIEEFSHDYDVSIEELLFYGGEEYHALFIIGKDYWQAIKDFSLENNFYLEKIGHVISEKNLVYENKMKKIRKIITKRGFEHFNPFQA